MQLPDLLNIPAKLYRMKADKPPLVISFY